MKTKDLIPRRRGRFFPALPAIKRRFSELGQRVFNRKQLEAIFSQFRQPLKLPGSMSARKFTELLCNESVIKSIGLSCDAYKDVVRFVYDEPSIYEIALSLKKGSYLCHITAAFLNNLTDQISKTVYVNHEQSPKPIKPSTLSQDSINRAFANQQRSSNLIYHLDDYKIVVLSGKYTEGLEVGEIFGPNSELLLATKVERTLIDLLVRPKYGGSLPAIIDAYRAAKNSVSINTLKATLKKLNYMYPYHQAIGFVMERAGYESDLCQMLYDLGVNFDFYLAHGVKNKAYNAKWRLFYPENL